MASFVKRGKGWAYVVSEGRDPKTGRYRQRWRSGFATKKAAQEAYESEQVARRRGDYIERSGLTVGEFLVERWLPAVQARVKPGTYDSYEVSVNAQVVPRIGHVRLQDLDGAHLNELYPGLLRDGRQNGKGGLAPKTVRNVATLMHTALKDAVRQRLLIHNPAEDADRPKAEDREMAYWTPEQIRGFRESVRDDRLYAMWLLFCTTGMRRGEVLGLRWGDVDLVTRALSVRQSLTVYAGKVRVGTPKSGKARRLSLDEATLVALRAHADRQADEIKNWGDGWSAGLVCAYDWESLQYGPESFALGVAAATWSSLGESKEPIARSAGEIEHYIDLYEQSRRQPLSANERRSACAAAVFTLAYTARCEHALDPGTRKGRASSRLARDNGLLSLIT